MKLFPIAAVSSLCSRATLTYIPCGFNSLFRKITHYIIILIKDYFVYIFIDICSCQLKHTSLNHLEKCSGNVEEDCGDEREILNAVEYNDCNLEIQLWLADTMKFTSVKKWCSCGYLFSDVRK